MLRTFWKYAFLFPYHWSILLTLDLSGEPTNDISASFKNQYPCSLYEFQWFLGTGLSKSSFLRCALEDSADRWNWAINTYQQQCLILFWVFSLFLIFLWDYHSYFLSRGKRSMSNEVNSIDNYLKLLRRLGQEYFLYKLISIMFLFFFFNFTPLWIYVKK